MCWHARWLSFFYRQTIFKKFRRSRGYSRKIREFSMKNCPINGNNRRENVRAESESPQEERQFFQQFSSNSHSNASSDTCSKAASVFDVRSIIPEKVGAFAEILAMLVHAPCKITREHIQVCSLELT